MLVPFVLGNFVGHAIRYGGISRVEFEKALRWYCCFHVVYLSNDNYLFNSNFIILMNYSLWMYEVSNAASRFLFYVL